MPAPVEYRTFIQELWQIPQQSQEETAQYYFDNNELIGHTKNEPYITINYAGYDMDIPIGFGNFNATIQAPQKKIHTEKKLFDETTNFIQVERNEEPQTVLSQDQIEYIERRSFLVDEYNAIKGERNIKHETEIKILRRINEIAKINFDNFSVDFSSDESVNFNLVLTNNSLLMLTVLFSNEELPNEYVIYTLFEGDNCIVNNAKPLSEIVKGIKDYVSI